VALSDSQRLRTPTVLESIYFAEAISKNTSYVVRLVYQLLCTVTEVNITEL